MAPNPGCSVAGTASWLRTYMLVNVRASRASAYLACCRRQVTRTISAVSARVVALRVSQMSRVVSNLECSIIRGVPCV